LVRRAEFKDIEPVLVLLKEFHAESMDKYNVLCDEDVARTALTKFVDTSFVLELDNKVVGVLAGMITMYPLNNKPMYSEVVWYVTPKHRLHGVSLYTKLEEFCEERGIKQIGMALMANSKAEKLERFYLRLGFQLLEKHYIKTLED
jgi:GNAT superfamily N-acetyltransferase